MARGAVTVSGEVVDVDYRSSQPGADKQWGFNLVSVIAGKQVIEVRWDPTRVVGDLPHEGEQISLDVELGVYGGRLQVNARGRSAGPVHVAKSA